MNYCFTHEDVKESQGVCKDFQLIIQHELDDNDDFHFGANYLFKLLNITYSFFNEKSFLIKIDKHELNWTEPLFVQLKWT